MKHFNTLKLALAAAACLSVFSFAAIPEMRITTKNNQEPSASGTNCSGCKYVQITNFALTDPNNSKNNLTLTPDPTGAVDSIRVRGNSTAGADKRPYRIKFDKKQSLFGREKAKSWVLLANYYDATITFVRDSVNALVNKMAASGFPTNGYRDMIDLESFAKYVLIQKLMDNFDFNNKVQGQGMTGQDMTGAPGSNYAHKNVGTRLYAGPLWDFDLAAGVSPDMAYGGGCGFPSHYCMTNYTIKPTNPFYLRLWEDPAFLAKFKKAWDAHQNDFKAIPAFIDSISGQLSGSVANNKYAASSMGSGTLNATTHSSEVSKLKTWWNSRMTFFGSELNKLNIDTSKDIIQSNNGTSPIVHQQIVSGNGILAARNSVSLQVQKDARLDIYSLSGKLERSMNFSNGVYNILLGDLPKGMYVDVCCKGNIWQ